MPDDRKDIDFPEADIEVLRAAQAKFDSPPDADDPTEEELLEDLLDVEAEDGDDVIEEDDDNPYRDSDEALADDDEERDISRNLRD